MSFSLSAGPGGVIRTLDLLAPDETRYQAALHPGNVPIELLCRPSYVAISANNLTFFHLF